jgi:hypothetical protein
VSARSIPFLTHLIIPLTTPTPTPTTRLSIFTPSILRLNYPGSSTVKIQLLAVAPSIVAAIIALVACYVAMRTRAHGYVTIFGASLSVIGYGSESPVEHVEFGRVQNGGG